MISRRVIRETRTRCRVTTGGSDLKRDDAGVCNTSSLALGNIGAYLSSACASSSFLFCFLPKRMVRMVSTRVASSRVVSLRMTNKL